MLNENVFNTNAKKLCNEDPYGIYHDGLCHYYKALKRLCVKIKFTMNEQDTDKIDKINYEDGCYKNGDSYLLKETQAG